MARAGRALTTKDGKPATRSERLRESIKAGQAIGYLNRVVKGTEEPNPHRINAAKYLISRVVPLPEPLRDPSDNAKDISAANVRQLITIVDGESERKG